MGIRSAYEYVDFFRGLDMGADVSLVSFLGNERRTLKHKLECKGVDRVQIAEGIRILEKLMEETSRAGQDAVFEKYQ